MFTSTRAEANDLMNTNEILQSMEVMHGEIPQNQREITLKRFKDERFQVLVATDVASRGLDIPLIKLVVQLEPPKDTESYIHRSGRTARAGNSGTCITFFNRKNREYLDRIEDMAGIKIERITVPSDHEIAQANSQDNEKTA